MSKKNKKREKKNLDFLKIGAIFFVIFFCALPIMLKYIGNEQTKSLSSKLTSLAPGAFFAIFCIVVILYIIAKVKSQKTTASKYLKTTDKRSVRYISFLEMGNIIFSLCFIIIPIVLLMLFGDKEWSTNIVSIAGLLAPGIFIIYFFVMLIYGIRTAKKYNENIVLSKEKKRFKYLDTFYYTKNFNRGDDTLGTDFFVYHVIQDIGSEKVYAITEHSVNARFQIDFKATKLLKQDIENGKKVWKDVNYNDTGSFWIDKEIKDCCHIEGDKIIINYFEEHKVKIASELFHRNPAYDVSLFNNAIFITGHAEFDVSNEQQVH